MCDGRVIGKVNHSAKFAINLALVALSVGDKLGPYEIVAPIGQGGMGAVYHARDTRLGRDVAVKVSDQQFSERFEREARVISSLNHPNICHLYDVGDNYLVMELVEGQTLSDLLKQGPLTLGESLDIARQICSALEAAHENGIVHRDLKPGNVIVKRDRSVKVLDFGLAKRAHGAPGSADASMTQSLTLTEAGMVMGTPGAGSRRGGQRTDRYLGPWGHSL